LYELRLAGAARIENGLIKRVAFNYACQIEIISKLIYKNVNRVQ